MAHYPALPETQPPAEPPAEDPRTGLRDQYQQIKLAFEGPTGAALRAYLQQRVDYQRPQFSEETHLTYARLWAWHLVHDLLNVVDTPLVDLLPPAVPTIEVGPEGDPMWDGPPPSPLFT